MKPKRVLIVNIRSLLMEGVESILSSRGNGRFDVISLVTTDMGNLLREVDVFDPHVIVIDDLNSFIDPAELIITLLTNRYIRLIVLNNQTSAMDIYDKSELTIANTEHLIEALDFKLTPSL